MPRYQPKPKKMATYYNDPWLGWNATYSGTTSSSVTWNHWINANYGTTAASNVTIWSNWVTPGAYPPTGSTITTNVWNAWLEHNGNQVNRYHDPQTLYTPPPPPTPEQLEEQRLQRERIKRQQEEREQRRIEAKARAKALLLDHLDPVQKRDYEEKGTFRVEVGSRTFQINPGTHGNVKELHIDADGRVIVVRSFCIPSGRHDLPEPDVHLSQKLMLEGGDDCLRDFHRIANITEYAPNLVPRFDRELQPA